MLPLLTAGISQRSCNSRGRNQVSGYFSVLYLWAREKAQSCSIDFACRSPALIHMLLQDQQGMAPKPSNLTSSPFCTKQCSSAQRGKVEESFFSTELSEHSPAASFHPLWCVQTRQISHHTRTVCPETWPARLLPPAACRPTSQGCSTGSLHSQLQPTPRQPHSLSLCRHPHPMCTSPHTPS